MIKKVINIVLAITLSAALIGCGGKTGSKDTAGDSAAEQNAAAQTEAAGANESAAAADGSAEENTGEGESASGEAAQEGTEASMEDIAFQETPYTREDGGVSIDVFAMDTYMNLLAYGDRAEEAVVAAAEEIHRIDDMLSTGNPESEISRLNAAGKGEVSDVVVELIEESQTLYKDTEGLFDIGIYPVMKLWGFPTQEYRVPEKAEIDAALKLADPSAITIGAAAVPAETAAAGSTAAAEGSTAAAGEPAADGDEKAAEGATGAEAAAASADGEKKAAEAAAASADGEDKAAEAAGDTEAVKKAEAAEAAKAAEVAEKAAAEAAAESAEAKSAADDAEAPGAAAVEAVREGVTAQDAKDARDAKDAKAVEAADANEAGEAAKAGETAEAAAAASADQAAKAGEAEQPETDTVKTQVSFGIPGMEIDLGGIAKGYTSSRVMEIFKEHGIEHGLVSLGGNVQALGAKESGDPWRVAIQNPESELDYLGILEIKNKCVITSGGYERFFDQGGVRYHHIIDPRTGYPADSGIISATIISEDGTLADGLSTSLFIMGREAAEKYWRAHSDKFDFILEDSKGTLYVTEGAAGIITTEADMKIVEKK